MNRLERLWPWILLLLAALMEIPFRGYLTDDTFIHAQFARNLMNGDGFSFNAGEPTYGFTSPLWVMLLALVGRLGADLILASKALGLLFTWGSIAAIGLAAREIIPSRSGRMAASLAWAANAWFLRWGISGMETSMAVFFVTLGLAAHLRERRTGGRPILSGLCWGAATLTRPECLGLIPLAAIDWILFAPGRRIRSLTGLALSSGLILGPWAAYALLRLGQYFPNTAYAKAGHFALDPAVVLLWLFREARIVGATNMGEAVLALAAIGNVLAAGRGRIRGWVARFFLPAAWMCALPALYAVRGSVLVSRYLEPALVPVVLFGFAALDYLRRWDRPPLSTRRRILPFLCALIFVTQNSLVLYRVALPSAVSFTRGLEHSLIEIGRWMNQNTPPGAEIAVPDIGAIGYYSHRRIIDLSGLVSPEMIPLTGTRPIDAFVEEFGFAVAARPDYLVDRYTAPDRFGTLGLKPGLVEPLFHRRIGPLGIARSDDYFYTVYRIHWDRYREEP